MRCTWAQSEEMIRYHDSEWGVPSHDDRHLFEMLVLEGAQAGLSWSTILRRREGYRRAFAEFDPVKVAEFNDARRTDLLAHGDVVRNRAKIESAVSNARAFLSIQGRHGTFDAYIWRYVDGKPINSGWSSMEDVPATTPLSESISKDLKREGFNFVGPTIVYSFLQAVGLVNDHLIGCFRYAEIGGLF